MHDLKPKEKHRIFIQLLSNTLVASVINFTVWFAITFFLYIQTQSVLVTGIISGLFMVISAATGIWFGSIVDHHKKKSVMLWSSVVSLAMYLISFVMYQLMGADGFKDPASPLVWTFVVILMIGVVVGNIRNIALPTLVTILVPEDKRDKANGLVGSAAGVSFLVTSVISGVLVALSGMFHTLVLAIIITVASIIHLLIVRIPEKGIVHTADKPKKVDIKGTIKIVAGVPGLFALILFTTFNNFLGGVFMSLMDAYGLSMVSVEVWGFLWGFLSTGFIIGGLLIAKVGLGKNPLKTLLLVNVIMWSISSVFTLQSWLWLLIAGTFVYMCIVPFAEAAEQTILQKVVPLERQGRVFGFAQSIEQSASPLMAFLISPLTQFVFIPFMTTGVGADLVGSWYGTGPDRGMALVFTVSGLVGLAITLIALGSKYYRMLSKAYQNDGSGGVKPPQSTDLQPLA